MYGNDVRHVVLCRTIHLWAMTGIQCLQLCPIHDNTRGLYSAQDCKQIPMQLLDGLALREGLWGLREECW